MPMEPSKALNRTIYAGRFIHSTSLDHTDICNDGAIGVDEVGKIAFIERKSVDVRFLAEKHGWSDVSIIRAQDDGFFFPGFIGACS